MALNKVTGERLDGLAQYFGRDPGEWVIVPLEKWRNIGHFFEMAAQEAAANFGQAGVPFSQLKFYSDNILVQEYPAVNSVAFIFWMNFQFRDLHHVKVFTIEKKTLAELKASGLWDGEINNDMPDTISDTVH